ncbi:hypothetical protein BS17DRAFT_767105 [Gyrodon lividus]|nr:hypothetical protein BS17DRAFT_767105 [Gyrodon lividus]
MFNKSTSFAALLCALTSAVSAVPATTPDYPEVIPGPGLPSLVSLGLTSADLHAMGPPPSLTERTAGAELDPELKKRYTNICQTYSMGGVDNVIACFNYLNSIGNNACGVNGENVVFCTAGDAGVGGSNISGGPSASSACRDVATGVQWVFTYCNVGGEVGGSAAAYGNGDLILTGKPRYHDFRQKPEYLYAMLKVDPAAERGVLTRLCNGNTRTRIQKWKPEGTTSQISDTVIHYSS